MLPLLPFIAGVAAGVFAANALRRSDVQDGIKRARRAVREAADVSMRRVRRRSAQWYERWSRMDDDAPEDGDIEMVDASDGGHGDARGEPGADAPRRRSTRRGGRRRRREEADSDFDAEDSASAEDDAPAGDAADGAADEDGDGGERA